MSIISLLPDVLGMYFKYFINNIYMKPFWAANETNKKRKLLLFYGYFIFVCLLNIGKHIVHED